MKYLPLLLLLAGLPCQAQELLPPPRAVAAVHQVPYKLTDTKHVMVRIKLNGKGPFNFILDTGAPAFILNEKIAEQIGVKPADKGFTNFDKLEIEGGITIPNAKGLVLDMFQLKGMNSLGVAGVELHGVLGYTVLAKYEITYDFTKDKLAWKPLDFDPPAIKRIETSGGGGQGGLEMIGSMMKVLGPMMGFQPNFETRPRGFFGVLTDAKDSKIVAGVVPDSPAAKAGVKVGDRIVSVKGKSDAIPEDGEATVTVERGGETLKLKAVFGKGL